MNENFAFNSDRYVQSEIRNLINIFNITNVVETGTYIGNTSLFFSKCGCSVDTIEINEEYYKLALENLKDCKNITCHLGDSKKLLPNILESLPNKLSLFYLDAHWQDDWPLLDELQLIGKYFKDNCIIVIDDFLVPNRNLQYDVYKNIKNDINYINDSLKYVFNDPIYYYNDRAENSGNLYMKECYGVGKIYIFPCRLIDDKQLYNIIDGERYSKQ